MFFAIKSWKSLPEGERQQLEEMKAHSAAKSVETSLVEQVRGLGHYPKRFDRLSSDEARAEDNLAQRVSRNWKSLPEGERQQLEKMKANNAAKPVGTSLVEEVDREAHVLQQ